MKKVYIFLSVFLLVFFFNSCKFLITERNDTSSILINFGSSEHIRAVASIKDDLSYFIVSIREGLTPCYSVEGVDDWGYLKFSDIPAYSNANLTEEEQNLVAPWNAAACDFNANGYGLSRVVRGGCYNKECSIAPDSYKGYSGDVDEDYEYVMSYPYGFRVVRTTK